MVAHSETEWQWSRVHIEGPDLWAYQHDVVQDFSGPGKPTDNAFVERYKGRVRSECLNANWLLSLTDTQAKCEGVSERLPRGPSAQLPWQPNPNGADF